MRKEGHKAGKYAFFGEEFGKYEFSQLFQNDKRPCLYFYT
jgi:hypothetical protein